MKKFNRLLSIYIAAFTVLLGSPAIADNAESVRLTASGNQYLKNGEIQAAINELTKAVYADPANMLARRSLARAQLRAGQAKTALEIMQTVLKFDPSAESYACTGDALWALGRPSDAGTAYRQALMISPINGAATIGIANIYLGNGDLERARTLCDGLLANPARDRAHDGALRQKLEEIEQAGRPVPKQNS